MIVLYIEALLAPPKIKARWSPIVGCRLYIQHICSCPTYLEVSIAIHDYFNTSFEICFIVETVSLIYRVFRIRPKLLEL
jgi:hypothetical protein